MRFKTKVLHGSKEGRTIGFPTVNISADTLPSNTVQGVYSSSVFYNNSEYVGALYYGPRLVKKESHIVLEIHIIGFNKEIYDEEIEFEVGTFIRGVMDFSSFEEMKAQLQKDIQEV